MNHGGWCMLNAAISPHSVQLRPTSSLSFDEHLPLPRQASPLPSTTLNNPRWRRPLSASRRHPCGALMTPSHLAFVCSLLCLSPAAAGGARRHHLCSRATFVTIMCALPPSQREQCRLSMSGEVLPKILGCFISTEMEMKDEKQQSTRDLKKTR